MKKIYAGIGSRKTPVEILESMTKVASQLEVRDWVLRSGGADGADLAFEAGVSNPENKVIYLPWRSFNKRQDWEGCVWNYTDEHARIAAEHHPKWSFMRHGVKKLHTRNVAQVLGDDCSTPADAVVCWTPDGSDSGGTGQAIRIAWAYDIPVFNLYDEKILAKFLNMEFDNE